MDTSTATTTDAAPISGTRLEAWRRFLKAHTALLEVLENELRERQDLPLTWYDVLVNLRMADDMRLRMQDLADAVVLSKSGLTRLVDRMEQAGLVQRQACPSDRRGTFAALTEKGRDTLRRTSPEHLRGVSRHFGEHVSEDEAAVIAEVFERVLHALDRA